MNVERNNVVVWAGCAIAAVLQILLVPHIAIFSAQPNLLLAYALIVAIVSPLEAGPIVPFVLGLCYDLVGLGPVGGMALLLLLASWGVSRIFSVLDNETLFMPVTVFMVGVLLVEIFYGGLLVVLGLSVDLLDAVVYRSLPCALYDCVIGLILYPVMMRLMISGAQDQRLRSLRLR